MDHLATIEAIYHVYKEYQLAKKGNYDGEFDNLLFYFKHFYQMIQETYQKNQKRFTKRKLNANEYIENV